MITTAISLGFRVKCQRLSGNAINEYHVISYAVDYVACALVVIRNELVREITLGRAHYAARVTPR